MAKVVSFFTTRTSRAINYTRPKLATAWKYSRTELRPPTPMELPEVAFGMKKLVSSVTSGSYKNLTIKEAWLNTLIGAEILFWFFAGECIGKGSIVGYNIPGAVNWDIHF